MSKEFDAVVIGAGPGGYVCAIRLAQLGLKTACIEKEYFGGVCLNVGCIPSKALIYASTMFHKASHEASEIGIELSKPKLNLEKMQAWKSGVVKKLTGGVSQLLKANGVESIKGTASFTSPKEIEVKSSDGTQKIKAKNFVIATGSRPIDIPILRMNGKNIISSTEALELKTLPKKMLVVGGGVIGVELGIVYAKLGTEVKVVEAMDSILPGFDKELVSVLKKKMTKKFGIEILEGTMALGLKESDPLNAKTLHLEVQKGTQKSDLEADVILLSIGRKPNSDGLGLENAGVSMDAKGNIPANQKSETNVANIYAIGDVAGAPQLAHRASMDGLLVAHAINGENSYKDYKTIPSAVYCDPEIAVCGLTEQEAKDEGHEVLVGKFPFAANGRALTTNETDGLIKVIVDAKTDQLLGVHMVGPEASNLISEATLAIEMGASAEDIVRTIHAHPTLPEAFPEAVESAHGMAVHMYKPKRK